MASRPTTFGRQFPGRCGSKTSTRIRPPANCASDSIPRGASSTVVLVFDSGNELVIHAMKARPQTLELLP